MKDVYKVLRQKEAEVASVRDEIQGLNCLLSTIRRTSCDRCT